MARLLGLRGVLPRPHPAEKVRQHHQKLIITGKEWEGEGGSDNADLREDESVIPRGFSEHDHAQWPEQAAVSLTPETPFCL